MGIFRQKPDPLVIRQRNHSALGQLNLWLPPLIAICVIATESTKTFGADHTSRFLRPLLEHLFGHFGDSVWDEFHHLLRKSGHFLGYGLVCLAFLRSWLLIFAGTVDLSITAWRIRASLTAILSTATIASLDEWHQTYLPNRTGNATDVLLDTCGATTIVLLTWLILWRGRISRDRRISRTVAI